MKIIHSLIILALISGKLYAMESSKGSETNEPTTITRKKSDPIPIPQTVVGIANHNRSVERGDKEEGDWYLDYPSGHSPMYFIKKNTPTELNPNYMNEWFGSGSY